MDEFDRSLPYDSGQMEKGLHLMESIIGGRWNPMILFILEQGTRSYAQIKNGIPYISDTELKRKLSALHDSGLIRKSSLAKDRRSSEYLLTAYGERIVHTLHHIMDISCQNCAPL
ncbi:MAG: winged helix-turn-helix transcriptional regulator [Eubacteriales bacterium]|nr:winged helix-turn-helix transcriptional regulator [Eubacteriales bacterium]MDD4105573.1 winged helix-turn-helix transcriptional regulator [Eubacteriales bacterium]MDD4710851.1 winged helix-turn-helix transcriptional regulator [Eubacteriales bacterium]NLO14603.1 helix-turn-helix transcriptional regulator [Clostridiales bacterium]